MKYLLLSVILFFSVNIFAQDCSKELLMQKPGIWKVNPQGSVNNITATDLAKEKTVLAAIHKIIATKYSPMGCQVSYSTVFSKYPSEGQTFIADPYHYSMYILRFLCDQNSADKSKFYVDVSTPTTVIIAANQISSLSNLYAANIPPDDFRGYLKLKQRPQKNGNAWYMGEEVVGDSHLKNKIKEYSWLITYDDILPFNYLSQKEYLIIQKKRLEQTIKEEGAGDYYHKFLNNINDLLMQPDEELSSPAICLWNDEQRFTGFVKEGTPGSFIAVKPNLDYYHKYLPKSSPQFFSVVYKISHGDTVFEQNIEAIKNAVDFAALKNMLGK
jgi:hypothetical protein